MASDSTVVISPKSATTVVVGKVVGGDGISSITSSDGTLTVAKTGTSYDAKIAQQGANQGEVLSWDAVAQKFVPAPPEGSGVYTSFPIPYNAVNQTFTSPNFGTYTRANQMVLAYNGNVLIPDVDYTFNNATNTITVSIYLEITGLLILNPQGPTTGVGGSTAVTFVGTGTGLIGGPITKTGTISIASTTVTAGSYGLPASVPQITVNEQGQLTSAVDTLISLPSDQITGVLAVANGGTGVANIGTLSLTNNVSFPSNFTATIRALGTTDVTLPSAGTLATLTGTEVLQNKTINGTLNYLTNIGNNALVNPSIVIGDTTYNLGDTASALGGLSSVTVLADPTQSLQLATKNYVDNVSAGVMPKDPCVVATTGANITLTGLQTIDTVALAAGNRVLVKDQTDATQNGIYVVSATAWSRASDADTYLSLVKATTLVSGGSANLKTGWNTNIPGSGTLGTTPIVWYQASAANNYSSGTGLTLTGTVFSIPDSGVVANTYGSASSVPVFAVNPRGLLTSVTDTPIEISTTQVISGIFAPNFGGTGVNNGTKTITLGGNFVTSGAFPLTLTSNANTNVTLPASGTLATLAGTETLTNKAINLTLASGNSITNIPNASLVNSSITVGTDIIPLGGSTAALAGLTSVTVTQDPTTNLQVATKQYVDNKTIPGVTTGWATPDTISVNDLFVGYSNVNINAGDSFTTSNTASFPMKYTNTYFSSAPGNRCGSGISYDTGGTILIVTTADDINLYSAPVYTTDGGVYMVSAVSGSYPTPQFTAYGNGVFAGVSSNANYLSYSANGITWNQRSMGVPASVASRFKFDYGRFFAMTDTATYTLSAPDTDLYTVIPESSFPTNFGPRYNEVGYNNRYYFIGGDTVNINNLAATSVVNVSGTVTFFFDASVDLSTIDVGRYITVFNSIPSTFNNVDSSTNLQATAVDNAAKTLTVVYPSDPGTWVSGSTIRFNTKMCSLDSNLTNVRYEPTYNDQYPPTQLYSFITDGTTLVTVGYGGPASEDINRKYIFYSNNGTAWNRSIGNQLLDPRVTVQTIAGVPYWFFTGYKEFTPNSDQAFLYVSPSPITPTSFSLVRPIIGTTSFNRTGVINNVLVIGENGGVLECRATNNIYVGPQNQAVPIGTYKCLGQTTDVDNIYMFKRTA